MSTSITIPTTLVAQTSLAYPLATITSVYASAASRLSSIEMAISTASNTKGQFDRYLQAEDLQASLAYYSLLGVQATATSPEVLQTVAQEAAQASYVMDQTVKGHEYFKGNAPSLPGNLTLLALFAVLFVCQVVIGVYTRQWLFLACFSGAMIFECCGYAGRIWAYYDLRKFDAFVMQLVTITLAPCLHMAGIYFCLAQLTVIMGQSFSMLKPMQYSLIFVFCDLVSIIVQGAGGALCSYELRQHISLWPGSYVMVGGLAAQVFTMSIFLVLWFVFCHRCWKCERQYGDDIFDARYETIRSRKMFAPFWVAITVTVILIFTRCIYRLIEMCFGFYSKVATDETYFMFLEALEVSLASIIMTVFHPGLVYGRNANIEIDMNLKDAIYCKTERYRDLLHAAKAESTLVGSVSSMKQSKLGSSSDTLNTESIV